MIYPPKQKLNKGVETLFIFFTFFNYLSKSYFKQRATKIPGITISPNPNIENLG